MKNGEYPSIEPLFVKQLLILSKKKKSGFRMWITKT